MMNLKLVLATLLLLVPAVYGCVVFQATLDTGKCDKGVLYSGIIDNGNVTCTMNGMPSKDKLYHYSCSIPKYSATFDTHRGQLMYSTDHGNFKIKAHNAWGVKHVWTACDFGCIKEKEPMCWVKTWGKERCAHRPHHAHPPTHAHSPAHGHAPSPHKWGKHW